MEIWLNTQASMRGSEEYPDGIDALIDGVNGRIDGNKLFLDGTLAGAAVHIEGKESQDQARALIGSVKWLLLSFESWSMIPLENLVAANEGTPTRIAAQLTTVAQIQGAAFALEQGVDAVVIADEASMIESAIIAKAQRLERTESSTVKQEVPQMRLILNLWPLHLLKRVESGSDIALISRLCSIMVMECWLDQMHQVSCWFTAKQYHLNSSPLGRLESMQARPNHMS